MNANISTLTRTTIVNVESLVNENVHDFVVDMSHDAAYESVKWLAAVLFISQDYAPLFVLAGFCAIVAFIHSCRRMAAHRAHEAAVAAEVVKSDDPDFQSFLSMAHEPK